LIDFSAASRLAFLVFTLLLAFLLRNSLRFLFHFSVVKVPLPRLLTATRPAVSLERALLFNLPAPHLPCQPFF
jgi:hypothetical protein